jgi:hypothetical protein
VDNAHATGAKEIHQSINPLAFRVVRVVRGKKIEPIQPLRSLAGTSGM